MRCYKCNSVLTDSDYCTKCGADVSVYKVVVKASNAYYNSGLAKAQVRDLSGAVVALRTSIKINKNNAKARNLLGLVYYEMGECAEAIKEWVVSVNLKPEKNVASAYLRKVKSNPNRLEQVNQAIKRYNLALSQLREDGDDVALIQLKKVTTEHPHFVKALLLLALLYMRKGENERCAKTLARVLKIDRNNTIALRYRDELAEGGITATAKEEGYFRGKRRGAESLSAHDVIAPRSNYKEPSSGIFTVLQVLIGVIIGVALVWFLIVPAKLERAQNDNNEVIKEYSEKLASYSIDITQYKEKIEELTEELEAAKTELESYTGESGSGAMYARLVEAANAFVREDYESAGLLLVEIDVTKLPTDQAKSLYTTMEEACSNGAQSYYVAGVNAYNKEDFVTAIDYFLVSYRYDDTTVETPYYLAMSYLQLNDEASAKPYIDIVNNNYASTTYATQLKQYLESRE